MAAAIACAATARAPAGGHPSGNVAGWVKNAIKVGAAPSQPVVTIAVHMSLKNTAGLESAGGGRFHRPTASNTAST